jgi:predicted peroxiredoxin
MGLEAATPARGEPVSLNKNKFDSVVAELREQGLEVTVCSAVNETWYIKDDGLITCYIASGAELLELKSANRLNIRGIKSLG